MSLNSPVADRVTAAVLFLLGAGLSWGGFTMDRLEVRQIHPGSIPGLVPMILGVALMDARSCCSPARGTRPARTETGSIAKPGSRRPGAWSTQSRWSATSRSWLATAITARRSSGGTVPGAADYGGRRRPVVIAIGFGAVVSVATSVLFRTVIS